MATQDLPEYLTVAEVAERYRTPIATVRYWRQSKYGPRGVRVGSRVLYPMSEIRQFDAQLRAAARAGAAGAGGRHGAQ